MLIGVQSIHVSNMIMESKTIYNKIKSGELDIDRLLNPGKQLHDVDIDELPISIIPSGFSILDREYMLLKEGEGELIIVGGRPSMGKSAFMFQIALQVSKSHPVHVFSLEMSQASIVRRLLSAIVHRPITAIQMGLVDHKTLAIAKEQLKAYNYIIDDQSGLSADEIIDRAYNRARTHKTKLLVIDYLQIIRKDKGHSTHAEYGEITAKLKTLAKELKCPVIVGSQLNRQCEMREDKRPIMSDLKESGSIEQDADIVLAVHREFRYTRLRADEADILVLKNRNGATGDTIFKFYGAQARFEDTGGQDI